jgi:hypothetical protein
LEGAKNRLAALLLCSMPPRPEARSHEEELLQVGLVTEDHLAIAPLGAITWTITEYGLYRTNMHRVPGQPWGPRLHFQVQGIDHEWPSDPFRSVMPPSVSLSFQPASLTRRLFFGPGDLRAGKKDQFNYCVTDSTAPD